MKNKLLTE